MSERCENRPLKPCPLIGTGEHVTFYIRTSRFAFPSRLHDQHQRFACVFCFSCGGKHAGPTNGPPLARKSATPLRVACILQFYYKALKQKQRVLSITPSAARIYAVPRWLYFNERALHCFKLSLIRGSFSSLPDFSLQRASFDSFSLQNRKPSWSFCPTRFADSPSPVRARNINV